MTGQQLKNSILQMAIQGKLVPQDPHDEPASVLLERIREEKKRLVKEGKIKKTDLIEKPISEEEIPFEVPEGWEWCRFGNVAYFLNGDRSANYPNKNEYVPQGIAWINTGHIEPNGYLSTSSMNYITEEKYNSLSSGKIEKGDLVYCIRGATYGKVAKVVPYEKGAVASSLMIIRLLDINFRDYIFTYLKTSFSKEQLLKFANGAAQPNLAAKDVSKYLIPIPPLAEQRRIVEKLESLMPLIESYGKSQEALNALNASLPEKLRQSILQEAIQGHLVPQDPNEEPASVLLERIRAEKARLVKEGKLKKKDLEEKPISPDEIPFDIPEGWVWCRFGTITINRDSERIPLSVEERSKLEKKYDYYGASGVIDKVDKYLFNKPLLLIGEDGANLINRSTPIAFIARGEYWVNNHAHVLDYIDDVLMQYMCWYINAISLVKYITGTAQPKMNQEKMNSILVPLPPLSEQRRIVTKLEELLQEIDKLKA